MTQQAVIQGRALTCRHVVSERHRARVVTLPRALGSAQALCAPRSPVPLPYLRYPRWLEWVRAERTLLTDEMVEAPRVMRMRPLSSNSAVLL